jgi:hypothetical protein
MDEQARMLKEYEDQQAALLASLEDEARRRAELEAQQQREFEQRQMLQQEQERLAQEQLRQQQTMQLNNQAADQVHSLEREVLALRGQFERDQLMLEQYDRVCTYPPSLGAVELTVANH